jgi:hypothetical protein
MMFDILGELLAEAAGADQLGGVEFNLGASLAALALSVALTLQFWSAPIRAWPEGSFFGLLFAAFIGIWSLAFSLLHLLREPATRKLSVPAAVLSLATLAVAAWNCLR